MKQVSTLFDALRNEKFAIAVSDEYGIKYYGYDGQGKEWAQWANTVESKNLEETQIPAGIIQGPYKNISDSEVKSLVVSFGYGEPSVGNLANSKNYRHAGSVKLKSDSRVPEVMDTPINYFTSDQYSQAVSYKCLAMRHSIKEASLLHEARVNHYAFNFNKWMYNAAPDSAQNKSLRQRVDSNIGRSSERRLGMRIKSTMLNYVDGRKHVGAAGSLEIKSLPDEIIVKTIGESIGSGSRIARRAGRAAFSHFDPKAWDGDGDGVVQEGTPYERPAIPGVNDRATGGKVDIRAATRAWEDMARVSKSPKMMGPGVPDGGETTGRRVERRTRKLPNVKPIERPVKPEPQARAVSKRISEARTQRQVEGFASSSGKAAARKRPGVDKMKDTDGQLFGQLDDSQKEKVIGNLRKRYQKIQDDIKESIGETETGGSWWETFIAKSRLGVGAKTDADGKPWSKESRISGEALKMLQIRVDKEIIPQIDAEILTAETHLANLRISGVADDSKQVKSAIAQIKKLKKEKQAITQDIQDLMTFDAMYENDDWSMLEHLSPQSRSAGFGRTASGAKIKDLEDPFGDSVKPKIDWKEPSSFFSEYESYAEGKRALVGKGKTGKLKAFSERVLENAEAAAARRRLRRSRRGTFGIEGDNRDRPSSAERIRRRISRAKRRIKRRLTGGTNEKTIGKEISETKSVNPTAFNNGAKGSTPSINEEGIKVLARLFRGRKPEEGEGKDDTKGRNALGNLGRMWSEQNFNGLPVKITEADAEYLAGQGWTVIQRGHGGPNPPTNPPTVGQREYIMDYIEGTKRFVTGEGGSAYGPGEYWSRPGSGWDGWVPEAGGTLALVSPDARVLTIGEASKLQEEHSRAWREVHKALQGIGAGAIGAKDMDPQDLVKALRTELSKVFADGDPMWSTEVGQVMSSFFKFMESAPPEMRDDIWSALTYLTNLGGYGAHFSAMLYGYDGVDHQGNSPVVWFNRAVLAVVDEPMNLKRMKEIADLRKAA